VLQTVAQQLPGSVDRFDAVSVSDAGVLGWVQLNEDAARMAELADDDDDDDDHSPSAGSAASLELYQSVRAIIPDDDDHSPSAGSAASLELYQSVRAIIPDDDDDHSPSAGSAASLELYQSVRAIIPDDDDDHSPSAGSAASLELYQSVRAIIPDGHVRDKDQLSMKSDCAAGMRRRLSILNTREHKVCLSKESALLKINITSQLYRQNVESAPFLTLALPRGTLYRRTCVLFLILCFSGSD